jgi:uncharacterized Zn-binding protein involved in type VI secretion
MRPLARLGDPHLCPLHGPNAIVKVASESSCDARPIAAVGDLTGCGAVILTGSSAMTVDGRKAALIGSTTSHGGIIQQGSPGSKA